MTARPIDTGDGTIDCRDLGLPPGSSENDVLVGHDGFLFLAGGAHEVLKIVTGRKTINESSLARFGSNVAGRASWAARRDIPYLHIVFPDKQSIVPEKWPLDLCLRMGDLYLDRWPDLRGTVLYPDEVLRAAASGTLSRVDTHVTPIGSILVAAHVAARLTGADNPALTAQLLEATETTKRHAGDLGSKLHPPVSAVEPVFAFPHSGRSLTNGLDGGNNGLVDLRFNPDAVDRKRCVMFGDSFGRDLCVYLSFWFSEVFFFRTGFFHPDLAARCRPDLLITENVERYLDDIRDDAEAPEFDTYLARRERSAPPSDAFRAAFAEIMSSPTATMVGAVAAPVAIPVATRSASIGSETVIEAAVLVPRSLPLFVVDQSSRLPPWTAPLLQDIHATLHAERRDVLLFGPSIQVSGDTWWCESRMFGEQFVDMVATDSYGMNFPGPRPRLTSTGSNRTIDFTQVASAIRHLDEKLFLATPLEPSNWGRWISTVISKVDHFRQLGQGRRLLCVASLPWQQALLKRLGIEQHELLTHDPGQIYRCDDLASVEYNVTNMTVSAAEHRRFRHLRSECTARVRASGARRFGDKIFATRLGMSARHPHYRVLQNERTLAAALEARGYDVIEPETLSFDQQVAAFGNARLIVCVGGAAVYNASFCRDDTVFVSIESGAAFLEPHTNLLSSLGLPYGVIVGTQDADDPSPVHKSWTVDIDDVVARLTQIGG